MIGIIAHPSEHPVIQEFFELFKTPWEFYRNDRDYEVLLCSGDISIPENRATLVLLYAGREISQDVGRKVRVRLHESVPRSLTYRRVEVPIYGDYITFPGSETDVLQEQHSGASAMRVELSTTGVRVRAGYDLFQEVWKLLTVGQPAVNAGVPTIDLHIDILRELIVASGIRLMEIPPVPEGYRFVTCLTHDVDDPSIRRHKVDHTMCGFLYRALIGSMLRVFRGQSTLRYLLTNWWAAVKLPFIHLGVAKDIWSVADSYSTLEETLRSSFFVIPFSNRSGMHHDGPAPTRRACRYAAADIAGELRALMAGGREISLHGIDAWYGSSEARAELEEIRRLTGARDIGVRMHWLYYNERSAVVLDDAGFDYDSTVGYNDTVGYRAGTTQAYKPLCTKRLIELPLHVMDTALFLPSRLGLSEPDAMKLVSAIIDNAVRFGGVVTVNWHDRSIAPERCWGNFYVGVLNELRSRGAWFATAAEAVAWFRKRREARFDNLASKATLSHVSVRSDSTPSLPALQLRTHDPLRFRDIYDYLKCTSEM